MDQSGVADKSEIEEIEFEFESLMLGKMANVSSAVRMSLVLVYFGLLLAPAVFVNLASPFSRGMWAAVTLFFAALVVGILGFHRSKTAVTSHAIPSGRRVAIVLLWSFPATMLLSLFLANNLLSSQLGMSMTSKVLEVFEYAFPWLSNVKSKYGDGFASVSGQVYKAEVIVTLWFIYGLIACVAFACLKYLSSQLRPADQFPFTLASQQKGVGKQLFMLFFGVAMALSALFGWVEFGKVQTSGGKCLMSFACYTQDDLAMIAAAILKLFCIFVFGIGSLAAIMQFCRNAIKVP